MFLLFFPSNALFVDVQLDLIAAHCFFCFRCGSVADLGLMKKKKKKKKAVADLDDEIAIGLQN